jgi:hypothetical protein
MIVHPNASARGSGLARCVGVSASNCSGQSDVRIRDRGRGSLSEFRSAVGANVIRPGRLCAGVGAHLGTSSATDVSCVAPGLRVRRSPPPSSSSRPGFVCILLDRQRPGGSALGLPDLGLITFSEMAVAHTPERRLRDGAAASSVDADDGYGSLLSLQPGRLQEFRARGSRAIQIEGSRQARRSVGTTRREDRPRGRDGVLEGLRSWPPAAR